MAVYKDTSHDGPCSELFTITVSSDLTQNKYECEEKRNTAGSLKSSPRCQGSLLKKSSNCKPCKRKENHWHTLRKEEQSLDRLQGSGRNDNEQTSRRKSSRRPCRLERKWLVLLGSFYGILCSTGFIFHMSVLFVEFLDEFRKTKAETSLIQSVCIAVLFCSGIIQVLTQISANLYKTDEKLLQILMGCCTGLISGSIISRFGEGKSLAFGTILSSTGLAVSSFAESIPFLVGSIGFVGGFGFSFIYIASFSIIPAYFEERQKFLALGIIGIGAGIGGLFFPVFLERLLVTYHWKEVMLFISGMMLNIMVFAMIDNSTQRFKFMKSNRKLSVPNLEEVTKQCVDNQSRTAKSSVTTRIKFILMDKTFICFAIAMMLALPVFNSTLIFLIDFFVSNGIPRSTAVWLHSGLNIASLISRPLPGFLARCPRIPILAPPICCTFTGMIVMFVLPSVEDLSYFILLACIFGVCFGGIISVISVSTLAIIGQENYASAFGILMSGVGVTHVIAGPVSGFFRDITGAYCLSFYASSGTLLCSCLLLLIPMIFIKMRSAPDDNISLDKICSSETKSFEVEKRKNNKF